jgi:hypothetical protein
MKFVGDVGGMRWLSAVDLNGNKLGRCGMSLGTTVASQV